MPRDSAAADRPPSYLVGTAAAFPLFFRDRTKPINQLPFSPSAKFFKSGSSCESRANDLRVARARKRFAEIGEFAVNRLAKSKPRACPGPSSGHGSCYLLLTINKGTV